MIFYSLYYFSFLNLYFIHAFFFFLLFSPPYTLSLSLSPFFYFLCLPHSRKFQAQLQLSFSLFFSGTLFFFFLLDSRTGYFRKSAMRAIFSLAFSSQFGRTNFVNLGEKIFSWVLLPPYFPSFAKQ